MNKDPKTDTIPKWLWYVIFVIAILYLIAVLLKKGSVEREDFPVF
jgi:hypothetical protein